MNTGLLWVGRGTDVDLFTKLKQAMRHYCSKYGKMPDLCFVHPSTLLNTNEEDQLKDIEIRTHDRLRPNQIWLGCNDIHFPIALKGP